MSQSASRSPASLWSDLSHTARWLLGLAGLVMVLLWLGGDAMRATLRYERQAILDGQLWRLVTGHLVHFDLRHFALNLAGAALMAMLFAPALSVGRWLCVLAASALAIDIGFMVWRPDLSWYVGLSGVLHGVLAAGAVAWWRGESRRMAGALTLIVVGKLAWEQWRGALPLAGEMPVVVDAHLFGAIGGGLCAALIVWRAGKTKLPTAPL